MENSQFSSPHESPVNVATEASSPAQNVESPLDNHLSTPDDISHESVPKDAVQAEKPAAAAPNPDESGDLDLDALLDGDIPADLDALVDIAATDDNPANLNDPAIENDPLLGMDLRGSGTGSGMNFGPEPVYQTKEEAERERMKLLVSHFDEQQMARYAAYRRANIRRASIKKFASQLLNQPITNSVALVLGGMSKVLIGDIIELARDLQDKDEAAERQRRNIADPAPGSEPEPLLPNYIREAWRIYKQETRTVPGSKTRLGSMNRMF